MIYFKAANSANKCVSIIFTESKQHRVHFWEKGKRSCSYTPFFRKIRKFYRTIVQENRQREKEKTGPEYKGPPDAIADPSDQK